MSSNTARLSEQKIVIDAAPLQEQIKPQLLYIKEQYLQSNLLCKCALQLKLYANDAFIFLQKDHFLCGLQAELYHPASVVTGCKQLD